MSVPKCQYIDVTHPVLIIMRCVVTMGETNKERLRLICLSKQHYSITDKVCPFSSRVGPLPVFEIYAPFPLNNIEEWRRKNRISVQTDGCVLRSSNRLNQLNRNEKKCTIDSQHPKMSSSPQWSHILRPAPLSTYRDAQKGGPQVV